MVIRLRSKNFDLFDGTKSAVDTKLNKLSSMFHEDTSFNVLFVKRDKDYKCEITARRGNDFIRSEELGKSVEFALDDAISTLRKRARKVKSMKITKKRGNNVLDESFIDRNNHIEDIEDNLVDFDIEKRKSVKLECITEEEAILNIEALNHLFFVFKNKDNNGRVTVVYKRANGSYGVLETN